jgi:Tfp pilus assembly protein PilX
MMNWFGQKGATLITALIFLVIMTLFAVSSINMSTINFRIVGNLQAQKVIDAAVQDAIEQMLSDASLYGLTPAGTTVSTWIGDVIVSAPVCLDSRTASGYSAVVTDIIPEDNTWEVQATLTDPVTGAASTIRQGVEMRMLAGNCPAPP